MALASNWGTLNATLNDPVFTTTLASQWGTINGVLLEPLDYISSVWGTFNVTVTNPYTVGGIPSVYDQNSHSWVTVQPVRWDASTNQWKPQ
jgi:hypothetical protein